MTTAPALPPDWLDALGPELSKDYFKNLMDFVDKERATQQVFPPADEVFAAFNATPYNAVKVVILGQDPYHDDGQAHGMCFSVRPGVRPPPSLVNIFKEIRDDVGGKVPNNGYLMPWAKQGVLLLNAVLTVRAHTPASHANHGWETFTDAAIRAVSAKSEHVVFVLWGAYAKKKAKIIDAKKHTVVQGAHPSPLSVKLFLGSKPFSAINTALAAHGQTPIDWQLPDL